MVQRTSRWKAASWAVLLAASAACDRSSPVDPSYGRSAGFVAGTLTSQRSLEVGQSTVLRAPFSRAPRSAVWTSRNPPVAEVTSAGVVHARSVGQADITLTGFGVNHTFAVTVLAAPTPLSFAIAPKSSTALVPGQTRQFNTTVAWPDDNTRDVNVTYASQGGTISSTGLFTAGQIAGTFAVIASCACGLTDTASVTVASLTSLAISPKVAAVAPGSSVQFSAAALWSNGATVTPEVSYSATGGVVSNTGQYTAPSTPGTYRVIVAHSAGTRRDTATVTVSAPQLTSLTISPKSVTLQAGAVQQFSVTANWATGATTPPPVTFTAPDGGFVSSTGRFTAPGGNGTYRVVVAHTGGTLRDTATVTVTGGSPPPAPSSFTSNLPPGMTLFTDTRFGNLLPNAQFNADGLTHAYDTRNATDDSAPMGRNVFETFYPGNHAGNGIGGGWLYSRGGQVWKKVYFSLMMWVPSNYSIHTIGEKFFYPIIRTPGLPNQGTAMNWTVADSANGRSFGFSFNSQIGGAGSIVYHPANSPVRVQKGRWTRVEMYCAMNTPGKQDGVWRVWVDGALAIDVSNVRYSAHPVQSYFDGIRFTGTRGGGASAVLTPPEGQVRRYNRLAFYYSTQ